MYAQEHGIPHVHARRGSHARKGKGGSDLREGVFDIKTGRYMAGNLPRKDIALVTAWVILRQAELETDAALVKEGKRVRPIRPLR